MNNVCQRRVLHAIYIYKSACVHTAQGAANQCPIPENPNPANAGPMKIRVHGKSLNPLKPKPCAALRSVRLNLRRDLGAANTKNKKILGILI